MGWQIAAFAVQAAIGLGQSIVQGVRARDARLKAEAAQEKLNEQKEQLSMLDTTNPFLNMENAFEDLTVNLKEAEFARQATAQQQANIMQNLRGAAGASGVASLAQVLAQQGQLAAQKQAATIGAQEARNLLAKAKGEADIQQQERQGEIMSRQMEFGKLESLMGLTAAEIEQYRLLQAANMEGAGKGAQSGIEGLGNLATELTALQKK